MATFEISPMFRPGLGFGRTFEQTEPALRVLAGGFPAYNILRTGEEEYRVSLAVPGYRRDDLSIETRGSTLVVTGAPAELDDNQLLYRGIDTPSFERTFQLAEHMKVTGARLEDGMLHVELVREIPEALRPRRIAISAVEHAAAPAPAIEAASRVA
jgi:molecular chaperone IbpA